MPLCGSTRPGGNPGFGQLRRRRRLAVQSQPPSRTGRAGGTRCLALSDDGPASGWNGELASPASVSAPRQKPGPGAAGDISVDDTAGFTPRPAIAPQTVEHSICEPPSVVRSRLASCRSLCSDCRCSKKCNRGPAAPICKNDAQRTWPFAPRRRVLSRSERRHFRMEYHGSPRSRMSRPCSPATTCSTASISRSASCTGP